MVSGIDTLCTSSFGTVLETKRNSNHQVCQMSLVFAAIVTNYTMYTPFHFADSLVVSSEYRTSHFNVKRRGSVMNRYGMSTLIANDQILFVMVFRTDRKVVTRYVILLN